MSFPTIASTILSNDILLKCWPEFFEALWKGIKTFDVRLNDRPYQVGKTIAQYEYDPVTQQVSGRVVRASIVYMLSHEDFSGIANGYVCLALDGFERMTVRLEEAKAEKESE